MDEVRTRYLRDRVMTATPAQRVVMIYDRLALDLARAGEAPDALSAAEHLSHASNVVAELMGSLDRTAGGPAENLAHLYGYLLNELISIRMSDERHRLAGLQAIVTGLRDAFAAAAATLASSASVAAAASLGASSPFSAAVAPTASAWVG